MVVRAEHILDGRRVKGYTCYRNKEFCLYWHISSTPNSRLLKMVCGLFKAFGT